jgi:hypothetical protein
VENERLLSEDELRIFRDRSGGDVSQLKELVTTQDAKSIAALIAWLDEPCDRSDHSIYNSYKYESYGDRRECTDCWQELKESVNE